MKKRKRNYEEVTNGVQKKVSQTPPKVSPQSGLGEGRSESPDSSESGGRFSVQSTGCNDQRPIHERNDRESGGNVEGDELRHSGLTGPSERSVGDNDSAGCNDNSSGLFSSTPVDPPLDDVAADLHQRLDVPLRPGFPVRHEDSTEASEQGGDDPFRGELGNIQRPIGVRDRMEGFDTGMTTEDCIHAMKLLARLMDVCNAISDYPNADMGELQECMSAFADTCHEVIENYYNTLDRLQDAGG